MEKSESSVVRIFLLESPLDARRDSRDMAKLLEINRPGLVFFFCQVGDDAALLVGGGDDESYLNRNCV
jgi:hypothetical protein